MEASTAGPETVNGPSGAPWTKGAGPKIVVVDTGTGNLRSVMRALDLAGAKVELSGEPEVVRHADKIVVPGQGAFGGCVAGLDKNGGALRQAVLEAVAAGKPYLGLCLGLQILCDESDEAPGAKGLGLVPGRVVRFDLPPDIKIPHMGWNACHPGPALDAAENAARANRCVPRACSKDAVCRVVLLCSQLLRSAGGSLGGRP